MVARLCRSHPFLFIAGCSYFTFFVNLRTMFWKISIAPVIYKKGNLIALALFTSFFALLFINIYKPLHSPDWFTSPSATFFYSSLLILVIMLTIIVSRVTMWYYSRSNTIPFVNYVIWVICEFFAMSLMYATIAFCLDRNSEFSEMLVVALQNSFLIMSLPYIISLYCLWIRQSRWLL